VVTRGHSTFLWRTSDFRLALQGCGCLSGANYSRFRPSITYPLIQSDLQTPHIPPFHDNYPTRSPLLGKHWLNFIVGPRYRYCKRTIRYTASAFIGCLPFDLFQRLESSYRNANVVDLHSCVLCNKTLKSVTPSSSNPADLDQIGTSHNPQPVLHIVDSLRSTLGI
jgi:hypothetical protein